MKHALSTAPRPHVRALPAGDRTPATPPDDSTLSVAVRRTLCSHPALPGDALQVSALDGQVTLRGEVDWSYQKGAAGQTASTVPGVLGVSNLIEVVPHAVGAAIQRAVRAAIRRRGDVDADRIGIDARRDRVVLTGDVGTRAERDAAARAAWSISGVYQVDNRLDVRGCPDA